MRRKRGVRPGTSPGIERHLEAAPPAGAPPAVVRCIDYGRARCDVADVGDLAGFLHRPRPAGSRVRWIDVQDPNVWTIQQLREIYPIHTLAAEDVLTVPQRPKIEAYDQHLFVVTHMLRLQDDHVADEQVSFVLFPDTLITFQERGGDLWDPVRARLAADSSPMREHSAGYLLYALLDSIVDGFFPILEHQGDRLEEVEARILERPSTRDLHALHEMRRELIVLRRVVWPLRQAVDELLRAEHPEIDARTRTYLRDVSDHAVQVMDLVEVAREIVGSQTDLYMSSVSNRMNEVMKVLTIMASLFIPVTFLAGVYGMNFAHMPELAWVWSYPAFWAICAAVTVLLLLHFRAKGWIGGAEGRAPRP
ncbi:MAG: magnesium/cobalt transporter CorA [Planctomycetota bacterium]